MAVDDIEGFYKLLAGAEPARRAALLLARLTADTPLQLSLRNGQRPTLDGINLSRDQLRPIDGSPAPAWWDVERDALRLRRADLHGASLRHANLQGAILEEANLADTDFAGANLLAADLSGAELGGALFEDAQGELAVFRFARGRKSVWEEAHLQGADFWGADLEGADFSGADLQRAIFEEANLQGADLAGVNLRGANLKRANLKGTDLRGADLRDTLLGGTILEGALLRDAKLQDLDLTGCVLTNIHTSAAHLEKTRMDQLQLGGAIGEEKNREFEPARKGYLVLERNFEELGDHDAARWAYSRRRRMEKYEAGEKARRAFAERRWGSVLRHGAKYAGDHLVEWVCDYGESVWRVLGTLLLIFIVFIPIYGLAGAIVHVGDDKTREVTSDLTDLTLFSMTAMTSPGNPPEYLAPSNSTAYLLSGIQTLLSIFLTGLMGFVAGNRIRR